MADSATFPAMQFKSLAALAVSALALGGEAEAYQEVARRLGLMPDGEETAVLDMASHRKKRGK